MMYDVLTRDGDIVTMYLFTGVFFSYGIKIPEYISSITIMHKTILIGHN